MKKDLTTVESGGKYLDAGTHAVQITDINYKQINGNNAMDLTFKSAVGGILIDTFWLTDAAFWRVKRLAEACQLADMKGFDTEHLRGCFLMIKVKKETAKDGNVYSRLETFWAAKESVDDLPFSPPETARPDPW